MDYSFLNKTQPKLIKLLTNGYKKNRISQVYLFEGAKGTPKMQAAMYLANMLLCDTHDFCGKCINCKRIEGNCHPRLFVIDPLTDSDATIKKEQIESLEEEFSYSALEEGTRVFIVNRIEKANPTAANSLLKFLEEMKENCYGILITENLGAVLETIKSRCQIVSLEKVNRIVLKEAYLSKGISEELASILCLLTNNVSEGSKLIEDENISKMIELSKKIFASFYNSESPILVMNEEGKFLLTNTNKDYHRIFIELILTLTNDLLYYMMNEKDSIIFSDTICELIEYEIDKNKIDNNILYKQVELLLEYRKRLEYNVNLELMYMDLFIKCNK